MPIAFKLVGVLWVGALFYGVAGLSNSVEDDFNKNQQHLQAVEKNPLVFEEKQVDDCKVSYVETSHQNSTGRYEQDLYLKSTCGEAVSMTKLKEKINTSRMKLANNQTIDIKKSTL